MYAHIFATIAPIFICAIIGYSWARLKIPYEQAFLSRLVLNVGVPALVIGTLSKTNMPGQDLLRVVSAAAAVLGTTLVAAFLLCRCFRLPVATYLAPLIFPNTVNMGLPVSLFAFGQEGLAIALGIYLVVSLAQFSIGVAVVSGEYTAGKTLGSPIIWSGAIAAALVATGTHLPLWLQNSLDLIGNFVIPVMLITLGVSLAQLRLGDAWRSLLLGTVRIAMGCGVGILVSELMALEGPLRGVVIIQSSMPAAVFNYILAFKFQRSPEAVAGIVVASTALSFISLPLLLWFLL